MISLADAVAAWNTPDFERVLKRAIERLPAAELPLQAGLTASSYVSEHRAITAMVIGATAHGARIRANVGIFYSGMLGGCACADDPTPANENSEYCVLQFDIDRTTGAATITPRDD